MKEFFKLYFLFIKVVLFLGCCFAWGMFTEMVSVYYLPEYSLIARFFIFMPMFVLAPALFAYWVKKTLYNLSNEIEKDNS